MNWQEIASGVIQAFRNAGVKKDVIDLQEKQLDLLTKQIVTLESEKSHLLTEISSLKKKTADLERELDRLRPKTDGLDEMQIKFLELLFGQSLTLSQIASALKISRGMAEHHRDVLKRAEMISLPMMIRMGRETPYHLLPKGREYLVKNGHV
jgi:DNA-binding transcriptional ArsR family regulator